MKIKDFLAVVKGNQIQIKLTLCLGSREDPEPTYTDRVREYNFILNLILKNPSNNHEQWSVLCMCLCVGGKYKRIGKKHTKNNNQTKSHWIIFHASCWINKI